jgi:aerobic-type carbon monoxide dehydrogenase small subunit (CoxS/CutS family)
MIDEETTVIRCIVNGEPVQAAVPVRKSLVDWLRQDLALTGSHVGCEHGVCGACGVVVDGRVVRGCLMLAAETDGLAIETIEGATGSGRVAALQQAFFERAALQCGFCTSAMILQAAEFLAANPRPTRKEVREAISGNYCRCTGYEAIVDAIMTAAQAV